MSSNVTRRRLVAKSACNTFNPKPGQPKSSSCIPCGKDADGNSLSTIDTGKDSKSDCQVVVVPCPSGIAQRRDISTGKCSPCLKEQEVAALGSLVSCVLPVYTRTRSVSTLVNHVLQGILCVRCFLETLTGM